MGKNEFVEEAGPSAILSEAGNVVEIRPEKYKKRWRYNSPLVQVLCTSVVAFGCPGMFNALSGLGGGGQVDTTVTANGNYALYAVSSVCYLFVAPIVYHYLGPRWTMFIGGITYPLYGGSLLAYNHIQSGGFVIATSAILGVGATLFWVAQGAIMTSAPLANEKGTMIGIFWTCFNMGGVIGDFIAMGINWDSTQETVSDGTYAAFIALMGAGWLSALSIANASKIVRTDGSHMHHPSEPPNVIKDFIEILKIIPRKQTILMLPFFFMSNFFYTYQQNTVNARLFDIRTRGFNGAMYWFAQMVASPLFGMFLDNKRMSRKRRGVIGYIFLTAYSLIVWGGGLALQLRSAPNKALSTNPGDHHYYYLESAMDMIHSHTKYAGPFLLYMFYGAFDAVYQTMVYWLIGCQGSDDMANEDEMLARYVGLYKAVQSAGAAIAWKVNSISTNYEVEFGLNWGITSFALIVLAPVFMWIKEPVEKPTVELEAKNYTIESSSEKASY